MIKQRIMYVCSECAEGCPEACGHYDRNELRVMPDGMWLCESCFDNNDDNEFLSWGHLPAPEEYGRIPASAQQAGCRYVDIDDVVYHLDDIEVDADGKCSWTNVANALTHIRSCAKAGALTEGQSASPPVEVRKQNDAIDEICIDGGAVHIEQMSPDSWFMGVEARDGSYWQFWFGAKNRKSHVEFTHTEYCPANVARPSQHPSTQSLRQEG